MKLNKLLYHVKLGMIWDILKPISSVCWKLDGSFKQCWKPESWCSRLDRQYVCCYVESTVDAPEKENIL